jgi:hypothetical protein
MELRQINKITLGLLLIVLVWLSKDFGSTWDEGFQQRYGELVFDFFASGFKDRASFHYINLYLYGGIFDLICVMVQKIFTGLNIYYIRHVINAAVGWIGLVYAARFARLLGGDKAASIALLLATLSPMYMGHLMNNPKDIPFASMYMMAIFYLARYLMSGLESNKDLLKTMGAIALATNIRVGGLIILAYFGLAVGIFYLREIIKQKSLKILFTGKFFLLTCLIPLLIIPLSTVFWPWASHKPFIRVFEALISMSRFQTSGDVFFDGQMVPSSDLPWYYVPLLLAITTPVIVQGGALLAFVGFFSRNFNWLLFIVLFTFVFPILYVIASKAVLYDGIRHVLFIYLPLIVFASYGYSLAMEKISSEFQQYRRPIQVIAAVLFCLLALNPFIYHIKNYPNEVVYYNQWIGGVQGALSRFELDYWGNCQFQAIKWIKDQSIAQGRVVEVSGNNFHIMEMSPMDLKSHIKFTGDTLDTEYYIHHYRYVRDQDLNKADVIYEVNVENMPLCIVKYGTKKS